MKLCEEIIRIVAYCLNGDSSMSMPFSRIIGTPRTASMNLNNFNEICNTSGKKQ